LLVVKNAERRLGEVMRDLFVRTPTIGSAPAGSAMAALNDARRRGIGE
jgi:hypothetical protein